jgi:replicative DNA helicase
VSANGHTMPTDMRDALPSAVDSERTILGAVMLDSDRLLEIAVILKQDDFSLDSHRRIFAAMIAVTERDGSVDLVTLSAELERTHERNAVGGVAYLASLTEGLPHRPVIENYIRIVKEKAICRALIAVSSAWGGRAYSQERSGFEIASWGIAAISAVVDKGQTKADVHEAANLAGDAEYRLLDNPSASPALSTGILSLDDFTGGGIRRGELWVIGASPSRGKTTLARQIVKHAIGQEIPSYVHSGEMTKESWFDVTACLIHDVQPWKLREPKLLNTSDKERIRSALRKLSKMPLSISDEGGIHIDRLVWNATRKVKAAGIQLMAVDYAQIIKAPGRDDRQVVTEVAQRLRLFAKEYNVATILLSQSPRPEGRNINNRPNMFSLKESGSLEESAHTVILPFRPVDTDTGAFTGEDELIIAKQRAGAIGSIPVYLDGKYLRFEERTPCAR